MQNYRISSSDIVGREIFVFKKVKERNPPAGGGFTPSEHPAGTPSARSARVIPTSAEVDKGYAPLTAPPFEKGGRKLSVFLPKLLDSFYSLCYNYLSRTGVEHNWFCRADFPDNCSSFLDNINI